MSRHRTYTKVIDGKEYTVTVLPQDPRLTPSATKQRQLWQALSAGEKARYFREQKRVARKRRQRKRR